jgi:hypothetical protein
MSSSRSIAAARNRRAGDPPVSRPNTSIGSSNVFSQQQPRGQPPNQRLFQQQQQQQQYQSQPQMQEQSNAKQKISIGDAIGLTTIRLCKVENFIKELKENGVAGMSELPPNTQLVDNSVLTSMINRLDALEKKEIAYNDKIKQLEKEITDLTRETGEKFTDFENAIIEIEKQIPVQVTEDDQQEEVQAPLSEISSADLKTIVRDEISLEDIAFKSSV